MSSNQPILPPQLKLEVSLGETNLVLEALAQLPYERVHLLIAKLQEQGRAQLASSATAESESGAAARSASAVAANGHGSPAVGASAHGGAATDVVHS